MISDKVLLAKRFAKATRTYSHEAVVQQQIAGKMAVLLRQSVPVSACSHIIEFGCGTGLYSQLLRGFSPRQLWLNDLCGEMEASLSSLLDKTTTFHPGDAELIAFPDNASLITSCSTLQWFHSPEIFFRKCHSALMKEGYLAFTTFGEENLREIHALTGSGLEYRSKTELENGLAPLYDVIYSEEECIHLSFSTPMDVLYHLKRTGVTGTQSFRWSRSGLQTFCEQYIRRWGTSSSVPLTYHPIYMIARKRV